MSGGHFDYFYFKLEDFADQVYQEYTPEEREISLLCKDLSQVLHDLEWWKSGDTGFEDFKGTYDKFRQKWGKRLSKPIPNINK